MRVGIRDSLQSQVARRGARGLSFRMGTRGLRGQGISLYNLRSFSRKRISPIVDSFFLFFDFKFQEALSLFVFIEKVNG